MKFAFAFLTLGFLSLTNSAHAGPPPMPWPEPEPTRYCEAYKGHFVPCYDLETYGPNPCPPGWGDYGPTGKFCR